MERLVLGQQRCEVAKLGATAGEVPASTTDQAVSVANRGERRTSRSINSASVSSSGLRMHPLKAPSRPAAMALEMPPKADWSLRITLVFRRDGDRWQLVHRPAVLREPHLEKRRK
jgi:hypothetical protein